MYSFEKVTFEQIFEGGKGIRQADLLGGDIPYRGNSWC